MTLHASKIDCARLDFVQIELDCIQQEKKSS